MSITPEFENCQADRSYGSSAISHERMNLGNDCPLRATM